MPEAPQTTIPDISELTDSTVKTPDYNAMAAHLIANPDALQAFVGRCMEQEDLVTLSLVFQKVVFKAHADRREMLARILGPQLQAVFTPPVTEHPIANRLKIALENEDFDEIHSVLSDINRTYNPAEVGLPYDEEKLGKNLVRFFSSVRCSRVHVINFNIARENDAMIQLRIQCDTDGRVSASLTRDGEEFLSLF